MWAIMVNKENNIKAKGRKSTFAEYHPIVQFVCYLSVLTGAMFFRQPILTSISFLSALLYAVHIGRSNTLHIILIYMVPMFAAVSLLNPMFNHAGVTILTYLPDGNPLTMESMVFGIVSALMFSAVILWCMSMHCIITSDRVIYLFGKAAPKLGLLISMIMRFIPKLSFQFRQIRMARHCMGRDITDGNLIKRISHAVRIFSAVLQWAMENAIDTADSLKSRGYGLPHRTSYSLFRFEKRDGALLTLVLLWDTAIGILWSYGFADFDYYPVISTIHMEIPEAVMYTFYTVLCFVPLITDKIGDRKWNSFKLIN